MCVCVCERERERERANEYYDYTYTCTYNFSPSYSLAAYDVVITTYNIVGIEGGSCEEEDPVINYLINNMQRTLYY